MLSNLILVRVQILVTRLESPSGCSLGCVTRKYCHTAVTWTVRGICHFVPTYKKKSATHSVFYNEQYNCII